MTSRSYAELASDYHVPVTMPVSDRQVRNNDGGYVFAIDMWSRLDRFLILGSDTSTFYQSARTLTRENAASVLACYKADPERTVNRIAEISLAGRAPKVSPAIFALALGATDEDVTVRQAALAALPKVCRTASHLFEFVATVTALGRGWGRSLKNAVRAWYEDRETDRVAYQMIKYRNRNGITHKRLLQTSHPRTAMDNGSRRALYAWATEAREFDRNAVPAVVQAHLKAMEAETAKELIPLILDHDLPWEAVPTWALADAEVWRALLPGMGLNALITNLSRLTRLGVLKPLSSELKLVTDKLTDQTALVKDRVHPFKILQALAAYRLGRALKGNEARGHTEWTPVSAVMEALDEAFYLAFRAVEPTNKRRLIALDVSDSMTWHRIMNSALYPREAAAAMAMVTLATEKQTHVVGFSRNIVPIDISAKMRLDTVMKQIAAVRAGSTDCSAPIEYALRRRMDVDVFEVYTDNETNGGRHPKAALDRYRREMGIPAKLIVTAMTSTGFSIADPADGGMLDVVGFDSDAPAVMADFIRA